MMIVGYIFACVLWHHF